MCSLPGCGRVRLKCSFCSRHQFDWTPELRAMVRFQEPLQNMVPVDFQAFLQAANPLWPMSVLTVMALLWSPMAVSAFATAIKSHIVDLQAENICSALHATLKAMDKAAQEDTEEWQHQVLHERLMTENGMQRFLGPATIARLLLVAQPCGSSHSHRTVRVSSSGRHLQLKDDDLSRCKELVETLPSRLPSKPTTCRTWETNLQDAEKQLRCLPSWANLGGSYIRAHILRKVGSLWAPPRKEVLTMSRKSWTTMQPDRGNHLQCIPAHWTFHEIACLAPCLDPQMFSMWLCMLHTAMKPKEVSECIGYISPLDLQAAKDEICCETGPVTPSLSVVLARAAKSYLARKAGRLPNRD
jgi:hypothetical protein